MWHELPEGYRCCVVTIVHPMSVVGESGESCFLSGFVGKPRNGWRLTHTCRGASYFRASLPWWNGPWLPWFDITCTVVYIVSMIFVKNTTMYTQYILVCVKLFDYVYYKQIADRERGREGERERERYIYICIHTYLIIYINPNLSYTYIHSYTWLHMCVCFRLESHLSTSAFQADYILEINSLVHTHCITLT